MNQFLTEKNFWKKYKAAKDWSSRWTEHFDEFVRIARNEPPANVPKNYANVSDGTTASLIRKTPKRVIQQTPTGVVVSDDADDWLPIVAEFIFLNKILPYANGDYDVLQKFWTTLENGLIVGGQAVYTPFVKNNGEFTPDLSLVHYADIFFQEGKKSLYACDYFFIRSWWQPETIDQIIKDFESLEKEYKKSGETFTSSWDLTALKKLKTEKAEKDTKTAAEEKAGVSTTAIEIVTGFQKGVGATFFVGSPNSETIVRRKKNKDPRGLPPVDYFYADVDGSNPYGRSTVELLGGMQNMIDGDLRAYKFNRALQLAPPVKVYGNIDTTQAFYEPDAIIDMGDDPNARVEPFVIDTTALREYPNIYGLNKSQLLNLANSGGDTSISSDVGNPGFGKTPTALRQQEKIMSADDNYIRKNFEAFFERWAETAINVYFAEREGVEELQLDQKTADKLRRLENEGKLEQGFVDDDNKIKINYSTETPALHFRVDASTSKLNGQAEQLESLQLLLKIISSNPTLTQIVEKDKIAAVWNKIVNNSGVENPEDLTIELPNETQTETSSDNDNLVVNKLRELGIPDDLISYALKAEKNGVPADEILNQIERLMRNGR